MRELNELSAQCGIEACAIVRKPDDPQVEILLSQQGVQRFLSGDGRLEEVVETTEEMTEETYLKERIEEAKELLQQKLMENERKEKTLRMYQCLKAVMLPENLNYDELKEMAVLIDQEMEGIQQTMARMMSEGETAAEAPAEVDGGDDQAENKGKGPVEDGLE